MPFPAPNQPSKRASHPLFGQRMRCLSRHHVIERHRDVGAEVPLDLHDALGGERAQGAVDVALELDPVLRDPAQPLQGEHLEAAGVGQHRPAPGGEAL
jgi:hypothetical protein